MTTPPTDINALCSEGLLHHQAGRLEEARQRYEQVLAQAPDYFDALHFLGVYCIQTGQLEIAVKLIQKATSINANVPDAYGNLANALNRLGQSAAALDACDRALFLNSDFSEAHGNRAQALHALGRYAEALESYDRVIVLKPTGQAHYNRATVLRELGRPEEALASYEHAIALKPDYAEAHRGRGVILCELERPAEGLESYERAIALAPTYANAHCSRGVILRQLGRLSEALESQDLAITLQQDNAEAHHHRGNVLYALGRPAEALESYERSVSLRADHSETFRNMVAPLRELQRPEAALAAADRALALNPDDAEAHTNRGAALQDLRRIDEALISCDQAIALGPDLAEAHNNRGVVLYELRRLDEAMASYGHAIALKPDYADAHHHQAMCRLALGDFSAGWAQYEWRWRTAQLGAGGPERMAPLWLGEHSPEGRTLLVHCEQGLGDTLQFCRYVADVAALGAQVILEVQPGLERLLAGLDGVSRIVTRGATPPPHDFQVPLMSLPLALGLTEIESRNAYLKADEGAVASWAARLDNPGATKIGLCWAGGFRPGELTAHSIDQRRSLPLQALAPLAAIEGIKLYSLQKGGPAAQLADVRGWDGPEIVDLTAELADFADTAALVANLDLVITCDTAVAHLAGGLGRKVWILNRFDTCWRWLDGRDDTPWYPSARLFTQPQPGDWASVVARVIDELAVY